MSSDTPPPELVDDVATAVFGDMFTECHPDQREFWRSTARNFLAALAEWATAPDGTVGLIDPTTWTVLDAEHRMSTDDQGRSLYAISPRGGETR